MPVPPTFSISPSRRDNSRLPLYSLVSTSSNSSLEEPSSPDHSNTSTNTGAPNRTHSNTSLYHYPPAPSSWPLVSPKMPTSSRFLSDFTLGFADGLTVPFALTAGLSSLGRTDTVVYAGVAEICAGSISMGIGGYLSARGEGGGVEGEAVRRGRMREGNGGDDDDDDEEEDEEEKMILKETRDGVGGEMTALAEYLRPLDLSPALIEMVVGHVGDRPHVLGALADISDREQEEVRSPVVVGMSVSLGYMLGGILPLFPYFVVERVGDALFWSFGICLVALFAFGFIKDFVLSRQRQKRDVVEGRRRRFGKKEKLYGSIQWADVRRSSWEGLQMVLLGGAAALAAVLCVRVFEGLKGGSGNVAV